MSRLKNVLVGGRQAKALYCGTRLVWTRWGDQDSSLKGVLSRTATSYDIYITPASSKDVPRWEGLMAGDRIRVGDEERTLFSSPRSIGDEVVLPLNRGFSLGNPPSVGTPVTYLP